MQFKLGWSGKLQRWWLGIMTWRRWMWAELSRTIQEWACQVDSVASAKASKLQIWVFCFCFLLFRAVPRAYESSQARNLRLGVKAELQLPAYTTATATLDPSLVHDPHHRLRQCRIINPLSKARDQTHILMDISQVSFCWATKGTPKLWIWGMVRNWEIATGLIWSCMGKYDYNLHFHPYWAWILLNREMICSNLLFQGGLRLLYHVETRRDCGAESGREVRRKLLLNNTEGMWVCGRSG